MTVFDVGANIGQYALLSASRVGQAGRVHAFEPTPETCAELRRNIKLNGFGNVTVNEAAVSDSVGEASIFYREADNPGGNTIFDASFGCPSAQISTLTLDSYVLERGISKVDLIKMDIEGAEVVAFKGARQLLSAKNAPLLVLEVNPLALSFSGSSQQEMLGLLEQCGYHYYPISSYGDAGSNPWTNGVAAKPFHWDHFPALRKWGLQPIHS
jgi:FkbM family methyltransferase